MKCPSCKKEFHTQPDMRQVYWTADENLDSKAAFGIGVQLCPSCNVLLAIYEEGLGYKIGGTVHLDQINSAKVVYPIEETLSLPDEVPEEYREDFLEAQTALEYSSKASAALSRRLLQKIPREKLKIKKKDLSLEIDEFISASGAPAYLTGAVDAVRNIGNFAAHPLKYTNTGEIVEVEEGESEWLLEVLESLCDFVFVQPAKLEQRRELLNIKLASLGKPPLKGA